ncbi:FtsH/Yme1/Tma family ATP-dependent metallopeptidase [Tissierella sp. Yu-01]|uniref:ATP-dependent metallopeptidase FtsH/Yme1/Tma family protein n=1 Tax=Tissierella sp. Yu-01 TaxID=3035694 RepID=UPI00240D92D5|nr:FtsH/Yme1/Tma family ATP-dependent metallopeptidase [Tissierella sp. Yu-01]WFA09433.1 ATP-dependent metallopeptidase FtsH/Yme1/Tma family protein [Tissierella sp. Yu-01]
MLIISIAVTSSFFVYFKNNKRTEEISYTLFLQHLKSGIVKDVYLEDSPKLKIILNNDNEFLTDNPRTQEFKEELLMYDVNVIEKSQTASDVVMPLTILVSLAFMIFYFRKNMSKQAEREMESMSNIESINYDSRIGFKDVAGNEEAKASLEELVDFIKNPEIYKKFGVRLPRGVLLYGPPGTGKTLLAKAIAGEANVPYFPVNGSDFVQVYAGLGASRIRDLFKKAKEAEKSVIFIDEIDCIGKKRKGGNISGSEEGDRTLNALLAEMSGFKDNEGIIVVAATNRIDVLDEALLRPGRFDRQVEVELPDINARYKILKLHGENKPLDKDIDLKKLAAETVYFSGAKLENLMNEAAMYAIKSNSEAITNEHMDKAYYKVLVGDEKLDRSYIDNKDKEITAFHEAGHALIAKLVDKTNRVTKVSIIPSTKGVGGFSLNIPADKIYKTKKDLYSNIMIALGGRAAEEIVFGKENITTGASSDLEKATEIALSLVGSLGMDDEFGLLNLNVLMSRDIKEDNNLIIRTKEILEDLYKETIELLNGSRDKLEKISQELLIKETINEDDINRILEVNELTA